MCKSYNIINADSFETKQVVFPEDVHVVCMYNPQINVYHFFQDVNVFGLHCYQ